MATKKPRFSLQKARVFDLLLVWFTFGDNCVKHIIPAIGEIQLGNLTPRVLQRFFNEQARTGNLRTGGPLSTKSLRNMRAVLDVALKLATAEELMPSNPVPLTAIKSVKSRRVQIMTNDSQRVLETYLFEHFGHKEAGILLALYTGMRLGEICALRWKNYQESTGMLSVESTVRRISDIDSSPMASKTQLVFGSVKTTSSERELYMPDVVTYEIVDGVFVGAGDCTKLGELLQAFREQVENTRDSL